MCFDVLWPRRAARRRAGRPFRVRAARAAPAAPPVKVINPAARAAPPGPPGPPGPRRPAARADVQLMYHTSNHDPPKPLLFDVLFDVQMECI